MSGFRLLLGLALLGSLATAPILAAPAGPVAEWTFNEGSGDVVRDRSGNGNDGKIFGARRVKLGRGQALSFDGVDDYVDCGAGPSLEITGHVSLQAWIKPTDMGWAGAAVVGKSYNQYQLLYSTRGLCWWYVGSGSHSVGNKLPLHEWWHVTGTYDGDRRRIYINGRLAGSKKSPAPKGKGGHFFMGAVGNKFFQGQVDNVRVYDRALAEEEIVAGFKREAPDFGYDPTWFERLRVTPYFYFVRGEIVIEANFRGLQPVQGDGHIEVTLAHQSDPNTVLSRQVVDPLPGVMEPKIGGWAANAGMVDITLPCDELEPGSYVIAVAMRDRRGDLPVEKVTFDYPPQRHLPGPKEKTVAPLPVDAGPVPYRLTMERGGGFTLKIKGAEYPYRTRISWPRGDYNQLGATGEGGEKMWKPRVKSTSASHHTVEARGRHYSVHRDVQVFPTHVYVRDTYTNLTDDDLGLLIYNELPMQEEDLTATRLAGYERKGRMVEMPHYGGASVFVSDRNTGIGMVPMDDVFVVQSVLYVENDYTGMGSEKFALAPKASYTLEWAIYPTGSGDYFDFVNTFRRVEDRIGTVKYAPGFVSFGPVNRRQVPTRDFLDKRGIRLALLSNLMRAEDNPDVHIEGIEFMDFPQEMARTKQQAIAIHRRHPEVKVMFHVAHSLYATQDADRFPDSKVISANGTHARWAGSSPWPWYVYYPAPGNSFHDAMMRSVDVMMDEMDMDGAFMDGFMLGYGGAWTYGDRWDQHSAIIDKQSKTIQRRVSSVLLLMQPSMIEFARRMNGKGGIVVANGVVLTPSVANEKYIYFDAEMQPGPECHLAPSVMSLANPPFDTEREIYLDMLEKLQWGVLFVYCNVRIPVTYPSLAARQYPMTFQEIRRGLVRGPERIVTMNDGVYGWPGSGDLHIVYPYDGRGAAGDNHAVTTVDGSGVRTELKFGKDESAVVEPLPASLEADQPVNVRVLRFDDEMKQIMLSGHGPATLNVFVGTRYHDRREGIFTNGGVNPKLEDYGDPYRVTVGDQAKTIEERDGLLAVPVTLNGQVRVEIRPN